MKKILYIFLLIFVLAGCKRNNENFIIKGIVRTVPEFSNWYSQYNIGEDVSITIENTNFNTKTVNGQFCFNDLSEGTYNLLFTKSNYSDFKYFDFQSNIENGGLNINTEENCFYLFEKSSTIVQPDLIVEVDSEEVDFWATINPPSSNYIDSIRYFILFINDTQNVAFDNYLYCSSLIPGWGGQNRAQFVDIDSLYANIPDFDPQKTYYAVAYGATSNWGYGDSKAKYLDKDKNIWIYMGLNDTPSNIVSFSINSK